MNQVALDIDVEQWFMISHSGGSAGAAPLALALDDRVSMAWLSSGGVPREIPATYGAAIPYYGEAEWEQQPDRTAYTSGPGMMDYLRLAMLGAALPGRFVRIMGGTADSSYPLLTDATRRATWEGVAEMCGDAMRSIGATYTHYLEDDGDHNISPKQWSIILADIEANA
jgi:hypothetical protein